MSILDKLNDAGVSGLPFSWHKSGHIEYADTLTENQRADIAAAVAAGMSADESLRDAKSDKTKEIMKAAGGLMVGGVISDALGSEHSYPTGRDDQANLNGLVTESLMPGSGDIYKFWCADATGIWARRVHTKPQIQVVGLAVSAHVKTQQEKYEQKLSDIAAANELTINLISW